jgi:hypothetical protein
MTVWPPADPETASYSIKVEWDLFDGRYEPASIRIATRRPDATGPITGTVLRSLPIGKVVDHLRANQRAAHSYHQAQGRDFPSEYLEAWERGEKPRLGLEHYETVAEVYKAASAAGASPTKVVAETFQVSTSTAGSWVSRARNKYGLLGDTPMGKAGI